MTYGRFLFLPAIALSVLIGCRGSEGPTGPQGPPGDGLGSLSDPSIMPRVIYTYPPANSVGPYSDFYIPLGWIYYRDIWPPYPVAISQFQIRFNKYMDVTSVRRAVSLISPPGNVLIDTNYVISVGGDVFLINPIDTNGNRTERWTIGQTYTFAVSSTAVDINGNTLAPPFSMSFLPEPHFRVKQMIPANGATDIPVSYPTLELVFNSPVDTSIASSIHWNPPVGNLTPYVVSDSTVLYFSTGQPLSGNTMYTLTMGTDAHDKAGNHLPQPFSSSFTTTGLRISSTSPTDGATDISPTYAIYVFLTLPVDTSTVRSAFSISPAVPGTLGFGTNYFLFVPSEEYRLDVRYNVRIDATLRSADGNHLVAPYSFAFRTTPYRVSYTSPGDGAIGVSTQTSIYVTCNALIDPSTVAASCALVDSAGIRAGVTFSTSSSTITMTPVETLKPSAKYTVTISTGLRASQGAYLKAPYTFSFTTGS